MTEMNSITEEAIRDQLNLLTHKAVETEQIPGGVILVKVKEKKIFHEFFGYKSLLPSKTMASKDDIYDLASLTKVISVWPAIMKLITDKQVSLTNRVFDIFLEYKNYPIAEATIFQLLTHTSGLGERTYLYQYGKDYDTIIEGICSEPLLYERGTEIRYSNRGFILLGAIIEKVTGESLDKFVSRNIWSAIGMKETFYCPPARLKKRIAPTEMNEDGDIICGKVHDENCQWLGGVAGHAGVFSTAEDLSRFCNMILKGGNIGKKRLIDEELIVSSFTNQTPALNENRGLAWAQFKSDQNRNKIFGHHGFTGNTIWIDIEKQLYAILLTNRVHPSRKLHQQGIKDLREDIKKIIWTE